MAQVERQQTVLKILQNLHDLGGLKNLFWEELNYERENKPLSMRGWPDSTRKALVDDPILFASAGEDQAFHVFYCCLASENLQRSLERPIVTQLIREHPYCLFVFSDKDQFTWHFLNIKYDEQAEKRRLFRRIAVRQGSGLRTATERLQMLDLTAMSVPATSRRGEQNLAFPPVKPAGSEARALSPLLIQKRHDDAFDVESVTKAFYKELADWYFWALKHVRFPKDARKQTGSFYTPREIVDYMVDEALIAYLKTKLEANQPSAKNVEERLRHLFAYNDEPHQFSAREVDVLIDAIDHLKALDPAVDTSALEREIDRMVYELYGLSEEEIAIVEGATRKGEK